MPRRHSSRVGCSDDLAADYPERGGTVPSAFKYGV